jgi:hypothetical protein
MICSKIIEFVILQHKVNAENPKDSVRKGTWLSEFSLVIWSYVIALGAAAAAAPCVRNVAFAASFPSTRIKNSMRQSSRSQWPRGLNAGVVGSNPTRGMDVSVRLFCVYAVLCADNGLATGWSPVQGVYRLCIGLRNWQTGRGPAKGVWSHR